MKLALMFPGQGSQIVGMLATLADTEPVIGETFAEASAVLGYDLWQLCQRGPEERLAETERTQPAMLAAGVAVWRAWRLRGGCAPDMLAGHSLGEYSALVCAGAIEFTAATKLVQFRGQAMQRAVPAGSGAMAAVLGLEESQVEAACAEVARGEVVEPANYNSPGQVVLAGHAGAVQRAIEACKARGAKRAILLPVSVPSHSALMKPAAQELRDWLQAVPIRAPDIRVYAFDGGIHDSPEAIRASLFRQLFNPVRWSDTVVAMIGAGAGLMIECGPGRVLAGLARRAPGGRDLVIHAIDSPDTLLAALAAVSGSDRQ